MNLCPDQIALLHVLIPVIGVSLIVAVARLAIEIRQTYAVLQQRHPAQQMKVPANALLGSVHHGEWVDSSPIAAAA